MVVTDMFELMGWKRDLSWGEELILILIVAVVLSIGFGIDGSTTGTMAKLLGAALIVGAYKAAVWGHTRFVSGPSTDS